MSEINSKPNAADEIRDPTDALLFIRGVISAARRDGQGDGGLGSFIGALLTLAAGAATWWMIKNNSDPIWYVWAAHNALIVGLMVWTAIRTGRATRTDRQVLAIWVLSLVAIWSVILPLSMFGVIKWWAIFAIIPAFVGMGTVAAGIVVWNKFEIALGFALVLSVAPLLYLKTASWAGSVLAIVLFALVGGTVERLQYKKWSNAK